MMRHSVHSGRLRALLAAGAALVVLGAAPAANAATVSEASGKLTYVAGTGEKNHVTIAPWGLSLKVTDTGTKQGAPIALMSGTGCWRLSSSSASCGAAVTLVTASLGDGDDFIDARDGKVDTIACGAGSDSGYAEALDSVGADCETVAKPALVEPNPAPVTDPVVVDPPIDPVIDNPVVDPGLPADPPLAPVGNAVPPTIPHQTVGVSASGVANVLVVCPPDSGGCSGAVTIELPGAATSRHAKVSATRGAATVKIGRANFKAAAGSSKSVPVRLTKRGRQRILRGRRTRARITVTTRSGAGKTTVSSQDVTIRPRPRAKGRKARRR
jgi:hypothetical protein